MKFSTKNRNRIYQRAALFGMILVFISENGFSDIDELKRVELVQTENNNFCFHGGNKYSEGSRVCYKNGKSPKHKNQSDIYSCSSKTINNKQTVYHWVRVGICY